MAPNVISADVAPKFYDSISDRYEKYYSQDEGLSDFIRESLKLLPPDASVLDIGSGTGVPTSLAVVNSGRKLHGIDISPKMIELSCQNVPGGTFELVSMLDYTPKDGEKYDGMFIILSMFHFTGEEMGKAIAKWKDWVKGNGEGYIFIGTIAAEDALRIEEEMFSDDKRYAENVPGKFMGEVNTNFLYTQLGWEDVLAENGFEIVKEGKAVFEPVEEAECDKEVHFFITARKL
ncbi:hypothetical protein BCON_0069g00300 [Botryotinia convoluta]|uniref:phosphoethanolamine N-methyltransferase n=1 Tax=Botryotinia convoluta TaxID=54673 RepID=A0A4Z1I6R2_9HELO|nr:hypothetical protein BCON_0069g00300 [Botryotinia convoluta]